MRGRVRGLVEQKDLWFKVKIQRNLTIVSDFFISYNRMFSLICVICFIFALFL